MKKFIKIIFFPLYFWQMVLTDIYELFQEESGKGEPMPNGTPKEREYYKKITDKYKGKL